MGRSTRLGGGCDIPALAITLAKRKSPAELARQIRSVRRRRRGMKRHLRALQLAQMIQAEFGPGTSQEMPSPRRDGTDPADFAGPSSSPAVLRRGIVVAAASQAESKQLKNRTARPVGAGCHPGTVGGDPERTD